MKVVFALYEQMTALDLVGPFQVFAIAPGMEVTLAASTSGPKRTDSGMPCPYASSGNSTQDRAHGRVTSAKPSRRPMMGA